MRFRTTLVLAGTLALLSLAYYFLELREAEKEAKTKVASFTQDEITAFSIRRDDTLITVRKGEEQWRMTQPVEDRGDEKEITALLGNITRAKIERILDVKEETLGDFGLRDPAIVLTVHLTKQETPFTLEVGSTTPAGSSVYARRPGERKVLLAPSTVKTSLEKKPFAFRSKIPLVFDQDKVRAVSLRTDSLRLRLERQEEKEWRITSPIEVRADSAKVAAFIRSLTEEQIEAFLEEPPGQCESQAGRTRATPGRDQTHPGRGSGNDPPPRVEEKRGGGVRAPTRRRRGPRAQGGLLEVTPHTRGRSQRPNPPSPRAGKGGAG